MAKIDIEKVLAKYTVDGNVDYTKVNEELQTDTQNIVAKQVAKEAAKYDKESIVNEFLKENEFKSIDEFNAFKKNGATADTEAVKRLENELTTYKAQIEELGTYKAKAQSYEQRELLRNELPNADKDQLEFYEYKIGKLEGETFEEKLNAFKEASPEVFTVTPPKPVTTGAVVSTKVKGEKLGWEEALAQKYPQLNKK